MPHFIYIPFSGVGVKPSDDEWLKYRIGIFINYTLRSLLNQVNNNFTLWLSFKPQHEGNPYILYLVSLLQRTGIKFICTYEGLIYHDDKNLVANDTLVERLNTSLSVLSLTGLVNGDYVFLTRLDSDDMLHKDVVRLIQEEEPFEGALTLQLGYVFNKEKNEVAEWNPLTNPPFHTIIMKRETFFDAPKHIEAYKGFKSHEDIARLPHKVLWRGDNRTDRLYCVLTHNPAMHISTVWEHPFKGKPVDNKILTEFGI